LCCNNTVFGRTENYSALILLLFPNPCFHDINIDSIVDLLIPDYDWLKQKKIVIVVIVDGPWTIPMPS